MSQPNLFDPVAQPDRMQLSASDLAPARELARNTDPDTSHEAAQKVTEGGKNSARAALLASVLGVAPRPLTYREIYKLLQVYHHDGAAWFEDGKEVARRLPDALKMGLVRKTGESRVCTVGGRRCQTWAAV